MLTRLAQDVVSSTKDWKIAFWHQPPYTKGSHDSDVEIELIEMRKHALPILEDAGVDIVLGGQPLRVRQKSKLKSQKSKGRTTKINLGA